MWGIAEFLQLRNLLMMRQARSCAKPWQTRLRIYVARLANPDSNERSHLRNNWLVLRSVVGLMPIAAITTNLSAQPRGQPASWSISVSPAPYFDTGKDILGDSVNLFESSGMTRLSNGGVAVGDSRGNAVRFFQQTESCGIVLAEKARVLENSGSSISSGTADRINCSSLTAQTHAARL